MTPLVGGKKPRTSNLTSTVQPQKQSDKVLDVSSLGISVIEPPDVTDAPKTFTEADVTVMMESMGNIMTEKLGSMMATQLGSMMGNMGEKLTTIMTEKMERQMEMMASKVGKKTPTKSSTRTPARKPSSSLTPARTSTRTPGRRAASRATSSPKSLEAAGGSYSLATRRETVCSPREMHEDNSLTERPTTIEVLSQVQEQEEEEDEDDIISGNAVNIAPNMTPRHKRLQQVGSASPNLSQSKLSPGVPLIPIYNSPASSSSRPVVSFPRSFLNQRALLSNHTVSGKPFFQSPLIIAFSGGDGEDVGNQRRLSRSSRLL